MSASATLRLIPDALMLCSRFLAVVAEAPTRFVIESAEEADRNDPVAGTYPAAVGISSSIAAATIAVIFLARIPVGRAMAAPLSWGMLALVVLLWTWLAPLVVFIVLRLPQVGMGIIRWIQASARRAGPASRNMAAMVAEEIRYSRTGSRPSSN